MAGHAFGTLEVGLHIRECTPPSTLGIDDSLIYQRSGPLIGIVGISDADWHVRPRPVGVESCLCFSRPHFNEELLDSVIDSMVVKLSLSRLVLFEFAREDSALLTQASLASRGPTPAISRMRLPLSGSVQSR